MIIILFMIAAGIAVGCLLRGRLRLNFTAVINVLIWALLFLLGLEVGSDESIFGNIGRLGGEALIITTAGILGSAIFSLLLWEWIKSKRRRHNQ